MSSKAPLTKCLYCRGTGFELKQKHRKRWSMPEIIKTLKPCKYCDTVGFFNVPIGPTWHRPGSNERIAIMATRYSRGKPLFHEKDVPCKQR